MEKGTHIPNADGAIVVDNKQYYEMVSALKTMSQFSRLLEQQVGASKEILRNAAGRIMREAAPGTTRVEFSDGKTGCVMVSAPDLSKSGTRTKLDDKILRAVGSVIDLAGKIENIVTGKVIGSLLDLLVSLRGETVYILSGDMVAWLDSVMAANNMQSMPGAHKVVIGVEELSVTETTKLTAEGALELQKELMALQAAAPEQIDRPRYEALSAILSNGVTSATVNVR